jgi:hypothetical protein
MFVCSTNRGSPRFAEVKIVFPGDHNRDYLAQRERQLTGRFDFEPFEFRTKIFYEIKAQNYIITSKVCQEVNLFPRVSAGHRSVIRSQGCRLWAGLVCGPNGQVKLLLKGKK